MNRKEILEKLTTIFRDVLDDDTLVLQEETTAQDVDGWDSLTHITIIAEVGDQFGFRLSMKDVLGMKNIGEMVDVILKEA